MTTPPPVQNDDQRNAPGPGSAGDPRLEIPEVLRTPIDHPSRRTQTVGGPLAGLGELGKGLSIALDFLFTLAAGGVIGYFLDRWLNSSPAALLGLLALAFVAATFRLLRRINPSKPA